MGKLETQNVMELFSSYSQSGQDIFVYDLLIKPHNYLSGTFLDVGCSTPFQNNNTAALEQAGWTGLLIDINAGVIEECRRLRKSPAIEADATTMDWRALCENHHLGQAIDYLSLDVDDVAGEQSKAVCVLENIIKAGLSFRAITCEHDRYRVGDSARNAMRVLLQSSYKLFAADVSDKGLEYEDWWIS
jgi:hypothetical protein